MDTPLPVPAIDDRTLGRARFVTLRLTLFGNLAEDLPLHRLHEALRATDHWDYLCKPFRSFHRDIVVPHATDSSLPLVVLCEPFSDVEEDHQVDTGHFRRPHGIVIEFPPKITMDWEGEIVAETFRADGLPLAVHASLADCVTFFESGVIAYSLALTFGEASRGHDLNAQQLLAIGALVNSAGQLREGDVTFRVAQDPERSSAPLTLEAFIRQRLDALAEGRDTFGDGKSDRTPFTMLDSWASSLERQISRRGSPLHPTRDLKIYRTQAKALRAALLSLGLPNATGQGGSAARADGAGASVTASIGIEIIGAQWHGKVLDYAARAARRQAEVDEFSQRLAGLAQNIFDFRRQDIEEVNDSLSSTASIGTDITFAQPSMAIRFMENSRAFDEMRNVLGGSPYWLLVQLVLGHNERLLGQLNEDLEKLRRRDGLEGMIQELLVSSDMLQGRVGDAMDRLRERFVRRLRLAHYIPNIFRYPTEQRHYELFARARGLEAQRDYLTKLDTSIVQTLESTARETIAIANRRFDVRLQVLLGAIGVLQVGGTFAALAAIWPDAGLGQCLWHGVCEHDKQVSQALLLGALAAIALAAVLGFGVAVSLLRHRRARRRVTSSRPTP